MNIETRPLSPPLVLILGAGINGCAIARELLLAGASVTMVDTADIASGATAYSSRLIHGGLRYLEYGEWDLVRESLAERTRLLRLAPHLVHPLELSIPIARRRGGWLGAMARFARWAWWPATTVASRRGLWLVRSGLRFYDSYARDPSLPVHRVERVVPGHAPAVDSKTYRWLCSYHDGQAPFPERIALALLRDAAQLAKERGRLLRVWTYHQARMRGAEVEISPVRQRNLVAESVRPAAIVNATGAWIDRTLARLDIPSERLIGGTKGSHLFTLHESLRRALDGRGVYAEAADGRPVFILPLGRGTLVGTTEEPFEGDPRDAAATDMEIDYLLGTVNRVLPRVELSRQHVEFHCSGVRPLPYVGPGTPAGITRRHWLHEHVDAPLPTWSVIGGKLTTCRALAESTAETLFARLDLAVAENSRERPVPGGNDYPPSPAALESRVDELAGQFCLPVDSIRALWRLLGTQTAGVLAPAKGTLPDMEPIRESPRRGGQSHFAPPTAQNRDSPQRFSDRLVVPGTDLPTAAVRWIIHNEWVETLDDLVERRLMLLYDRLTLCTVHSLAELMADEGRLDDPVAAAGATIEQLAHRYGKRVVE